MENKKEVERPRLLRAPQTPPPGAAKRPPVSSTRPQPRALPERTLTPQVCVEEQKSAQEHDETCGHTQDQNDVRVAHTAPLSKATIPRRNDRCGSIRSRPFEGNLKIDVDAVEMGAPSIVGSPLGYYASKRLPSNIYENNSVSRSTAAESNAGSGMPPLAPHFLEYGMIVSFVCDDRGGILAAEGFASRDVKLEKLKNGERGSVARFGLGGKEERRLFMEGGLRLLSSPLRDCLFEVVPKMTYDATIALRLLIDDTGQISKQSSNQHTLANLRFKSEAEIRLNVMMYKSLRGTQVTYGQTIQLRHVKTGKYVTLDPSLIPFRGSEYAPVYLDTGGNNSHFSVLPRFKLRSKGAFVQLTDQMIFSGGTESQPFNLFVSNQNMADAVSIGVVGSSVHSLQWRAVYFDSLDGESFAFGEEVCSSFLNDKVLRAGSCVRLLHLESSSWLGFQDSEAQNVLRGPVTLCYSEESEVEDGDKCTLSSDSLWEIEHVLPYEGGQIKWRDAFTLRHLITGKYLAVTDAQSPLATTRSGVASRFPSHVYSQVFAYDQPQPFQFVPTAIADEESQIASGEMALIQHRKTNSFIHSIDTHASTTADIRQSTKPLAHNSGHGKNSATPKGASFTVVTLHGARDEDAFKIVQITQAEVTDILLLISYKNVLNQFMSLFSTDSLYTGQLVSRFDRESTIDVLGRIENVLGELINFSAEADNAVSDKRRCRQNLFRVHLYIELLVGMIKAPFQKYGGPFSIKEVCLFSDEYLDSIKDLGDDYVTLETKGSLSQLTTESLPAFQSSDGSPHSTGLVTPRRSMPSQKNNLCRRKSTAGADRHTAAMQSLNRIIPAINVLLLNISWKNRTNELYVVKVAMPVLMELLGNGFQTSLPLSYLLRENRNLVESITGCTELIRSFFELIASRGRSIRYMQFLVALCTSRGKGVPKTQEAICELLFNPSNGYRDVVIVPFRPSKSGFDICTSNYVPSNLDQDIDVMLNRSVMTKEAELSTKTWMPLTKFYEEYYMKAKHRALGQYCYGLLRLYVSLCLDRNYISIEYIQMAFPRDNILFSVMDPLLSRSLRSVMMDLLRVAYIDCEPQKVMTCPNYTRIWTEISAGPAKFLSGLTFTEYSPEDLAFITKLKNFCFTYFNNLQGSIAIDEVPENELTLAVLRIARKFTEFGMYFSEDELSRFVVLLVDLLDERTDSIIETPENDDMSTVQHTKMKEHKLQTSLVSPFGFSLRQTATINNTHASSMSRQQRKSLIGDRRPGWRSGLQKSAQTKNSVLFDGAGAMSSIRITKKCDAMKQFEMIERGCLSGHQISTDASSENISNGHKNKFLMHKADVHSTASVNFYEMNDVNRVAMEIKDEICAIFLLLDQVRVDYLISTMLASYQARHGGPPSCSPARKRDPDAIHTALFDDAIMRETVSNAFTAYSRGANGDTNPTKISPLAVYLFGSNSLKCKLSLTSLSKRVVTTIFMQMLMYEYPPLVSKALQLLLQQYNQHDQFLKEMQNVQLLVSETTISIYNKLKSDVDDLRRLAETTEVWMDLTSRSDFEKASSVCQLLQSLFNIIDSSKPPVAIEKATEIEAHHQLQTYITRRLESYNKFGEGDTNRFADQFSTNTKSALNQVSLPQENMFKHAHQQTIEKQPPNRKLNYLMDRYVLNPNFGRASQFSCRHDLVPPLCKSKPIRATEDSSTKNDPMDDRTSAMEARRLLRNLRAAQFVLSMLIDGAHLYEGHLFDDRDVKQHSPGSPTIRSKIKLQKRQRDQIRCVFAQAMRFLRAFCMDDASNQALIAPHATMIVKYVRELPVAQELLVAIYANNISLYKLVPTEVINTFVDCLIRDGPEPRYLFFLETLVLCDEHPVVESQLLVLFQLIKSFQNAKILFMFDDAPRIVELLGDLLDRYSNSKRTINGTSKTLQESGTNDVSRAVTVSEAEGSPLSQNTQLAMVANTGKIIEYHVRLLNLFAACGTGKNTRVQEICQQILPLNIILDLMSQGNCTEGLHFASLRFLDQIFLTADDIETPGEDDLLQIIMVVSQVCERSVIKHLSHIRVKDLNRHASLSLQKNKSKAEKGVGLFSQKPLESAPLYLILFSVIPTLHRFIQQFSMFVDDSKEAQYYLIDFNSHVALLLTVCAVSKWQLPEDAFSNLEEFIYVIDESVRPIMLQCQSPHQISLEQAWSKSLTYVERLDCSSLDCELALHDLLQWALHMRDQETKIGTPNNLARNGYTNESIPPRLPEATSSGMKDTSPVKQVFQNGRPNIIGFSGSNAAEDTQSGASPGKVCATLKLENVGKAAEWEEYGSLQSHQDNKISLMGTAESTIDVTDPRNRGRLLHRLSPGDYYKDLRNGKDCPSPNKETPISPMSNEFMALNNGGQSQSASCLAHKRQHFSELDQFLTWLQAHPGIHDAMRDELNEMVQGILNIENSMKEEYNPHVHVRNVGLSFDLVVGKLVEHVESLQDVSYFKTKLTLLNVFCRMIYAVENIEERHNMQVKLNQLGLTRLVVKLISTCENDALFTSGIDVGVALLDGMNAEVQVSFYTHWSEPSNAQFFSRIQVRIEKGCKLIHGVDRNTGGTQDELAFFSSIKKAQHRQSIFGLNLDELSSDKAAAMENGKTKRLGEPITSIFRFLQLLCEGHYLDAQRSLISQPNATVSANLVEITTTFLLDTYLALTELDISLITQLFETITEYCQGPCMVAQETVTNYKFVSAVNALLTHKFEQRDIRAKNRVHQLQAAIVITLLSLLEGRNDQVIHSQLVQELDFEALKIILVEVYLYFLRQHGVYAGNVNCSHDLYLSMGFNIYILLQQLADQHFNQTWWIPVEDEPYNQAWLPPQLNQNKVSSASAGDLDGSPEYRDAFCFFQKNSVKVEVVWDRHQSLVPNAPNRIKANCRIQGVSKVDIFSARVVKTLPSKLDDGSTAALMSFYFPIHPICSCLTEKSKKKLVWDVSRGSDKLSDFYTRSDKLVDEMIHQSHIRCHTRVAWVARKSEKIKCVSFTVAVLINLVVLLFYRAGGIYSRPFPTSDVTFVHTWGMEVESPEPSVWIDIALSLAGTVLIGLYTMVLICYMLNSAPLLIKKGWKRRHRKEHARYSKHFAHRAHQRATRGKERKSFQDTEQLLRSLQEQEEEYNYLFFPSPNKKQFASKQTQPASPRVNSLVSLSGKGLAKRYRKDGVRKEVASFRSRFRIQLETTTISLYFLVRSPRVIYSLLQILFSVLGAYVNKFYFAFLLLDVVDRYKELNNVLRSISRPAKALGVTTLLYLIVVYVFSVVGFFFFREDYTPANELSEAQLSGRAPYTCQRLFQCFLTSLDQGLKSDGGLGSFLRQQPLGMSAHSYGRLAFDVLYNIVLVVLLLNLIFGVIIDTFASLRTDDQEKLLDMRNRCFICSIDAYTFDRATKSGFHDHISRDHNMWHYLYLFVHIRKKRITDYNGLELFLAIRMAKKDMSFFPTHRAVSLTKREDLDESHDMDADDARFYAATTSCGSRHYAVTPMSPSRMTSVGSGTLSLRRDSYESQARARSKRNSSISFLTTNSRSGSYMETIPGAQAIDSGSLEKIESAISTLADSQFEFKEAQRRAEVRYAELINIMSAWKQQPTPPSHLPAPRTSMSISAPPPVKSRIPVVRTQGSVTPRIFNFKNMTDLSPSLVPLVTPSSTPTLATSHAIVSSTSRTFEGEWNVSEGKVEDRNNFLGVGQDWFAATPERRRPAPPPSNALRTTSHLSSNSEFQGNDRVSLDPSTLTDESSSQRSLPRPRKLDAVVFNFDFISDDEEEYKEEDSSISPQPRELALQ